jgi:hypothetical protein
VPVILPKVPAMVFGGSKKSVVFDPVEIGLCRHFSENAVICISRHFQKCHHSLFQALLNMPRNLFTGTFEYAAESFFFVGTFKRCHEILLALLEDVMESFCWHFLKCHEFFCQHFKKMLCYIFSGTF